MAYHFQTIQNILLLVLRAIIIGIILNSVSFYMPISQSNQIIRLIFQKIILIKFEMTDKLSIAFDEQNNIRILDPEKFRQSDQLKSLSMQFITKVISMDQTMSSLTECLDDFAVRIQKQKLRALGERNKWESETENRKRKMMELNNFLNQKKAELERYTVELQSLSKVQAEQKALINKLSSIE